MIDRLHDGRITEDSRLGHWAFPFAEMRALAGAGGRGRWYFEAVNSRGKRESLYETGMFSFA